MSKMENKATQSDSYAAFVTQWWTVIHNVHEQERAPDLL